MPNTATPRGGLARKILFTLLSFAIVLFIFANSAQIGELSGARSQWVMELLNRLLSGAGVGFRFSHFLVRKLAHFAEYALLGFWLAMNLRIYTRRMLPHISWPLLGGLLTAVTDESLQTLIPGRDGQVADVLIDFGGVLAGVLAWLLLRFIWQLFRLRRESRRVP